MEHLHNWWAQAFCSMSKWWRKREHCRCSAILAREEYSAPYLFTAFSVCTLKRLLFLTHLSSFLLCRLTLPWPQRSATSPRCSRTATKTQLTSSLSRCRTRPPPQQPLKLDSKTIASQPIGVHLENNVERNKPFCFIIYSLSPFDSCAVTQVDAWTWINIQISNVFSLFTFRSLHYIINGFCVL